MSKLSEEDKHRIYAELLEDRLDAIFESMPTATQTGRRFDSIDRRLDTIEQGLAVLTDAITVQADDVEDQERRLRRLESAS
jgi:hypothetical protein